MSHSGSNHTLARIPASAATFGAQLVRQAREAKGYSREDLAVTCGLTVEEIEDLELGNAASPGYLRRVASALGLEATHVN